MSKPDLAYQIVGAVVEAMDRPTIGRWDAAMLAVRNILSEWGMDPDPLPPSQTPQVLSPEDK